jgi:isopenicillin N synthase-like dioxygenase
MSIPSVDLSKFTKGSKEERQQFVEELGKAYEEVGFVAVKNHGIPQDLIDELYQYVKEFFSLPSVL